jgi:hypothetical protein
MKLVIDCIIICIILYHQNNVTNLSTINRIKIICKGIMLRLVAFSNPLTNFLSNCVFSMIFRLSKLIKQATMIKKIFQFNSSVEIMVKIFAVKVNTMYIIYLTFDI